MRGSTFTEPHYIFHSIYDGIVPINHDKKEFPIVWTVIQNFMTGNSWNPSLVVMIRMTCGKVTAGADSAGVIVDIVDS